MLIIEHNARGIVAIPDCQSLPNMEILRAHSLSEGLFLLKHAPPDWILLDPNCQSSCAEDLFSFLRQAAGIPMQVVAGAPAPDNLNADIPCTSAAPSPIEARIGSLAANIVRHAQHRHNQEVASAPTHTQALRLRQNSPQVFEILEGLYQEALTSWVSQLPYCASDRNAPLQAVVQRLEELRAHPRDVVELHLAAMRATLAKAPPRTSRLYLKAGQTLLLKVMGRLASQYLQASIHHASTCQAQPSAASMLSSS
ncbi:MAG: hypothetical protein U0R19_07220 [Bryobacteraceae bacterium]